MSAEQSGQSKKIVQTDNDALDRLLSMEHKDQTETVHLTSDGEFDLVEIPDGMEHKTAICAQKQSISEAQRQIAEAMPRHLEQLVDVNKKLNGKLFTEWNKSGKNLTLISKDKIDRRNDDFILVNKYGFYAFHTRYTDFDTDNTLEGLSHLKNSHFRDPHLLSGGQVSIRFMYLSFGIKEDFIELKMIGMSKANEIINELIKKQLEKQKDERCLFEEATKNLRREVENVSDNKLEIPEIPNNQTFQPNSIQNRVGNFLSNIFSKKKKN